MARKRTDREITERLHQLLTHQEDLQGQLGGLTEHLRGELDALTRPDDETDSGAVRHVELDHVLDLLGSVSVAPTEADAVEVIVSAARQLLPSTRGALCLSTTDSDQMAVVGVWDVDEQWNRPYRESRTAESPSQQLAGRVDSGPTGQAVVFSIRGFGLRLGELRVWAEDATGPLPEDELEGRGELLARSAGLVLGGMNLQQRLRYHTVRDPLTGLFNQRYLLDTLQREIHQARRQDYPLGVVMFDLDRFGQFNDRYGHEAGDRMLQAIADRMLEDFRESDVACRYSGERFVLLLPQSGTRDTARRAESLCRDIAGLQSRDGGRVTVSVGVAAFPSEAQRADDLIAAVESGILLARQAGGDRVHIAERG